VRIHIFQGLLLLFGMLVIASILDPVLALTLCVSLPLLAFVSFRFRIRVRAPRGQRVSSAAVYVNGRRVRVLRGRRLRAVVDLRGLPAAPETRNALVAGFHRAFEVGAGFAALGALAAGTMLWRVKRPAPQAAPAAEAASAG